MESQTKRFDDMSRKIEEISAKQDATSRNVYEILNILKGDSFANGMVDAVKDHEKRLKKLEDLRSKATWTILGMSIPSGYGLMEIFKRIFVVLVVLSLFTSCMTAKKREDLAYRHFRENPVQLAKLSSIHYPVRARQGLVVFDTLRRTIFRDSVLCPDSTKLVCPPCEDLIINSTRVDTVPDLAKIAALTGELDRLKIQEAVLLANTERLKKQAKTRLYICIGLGLICLVSIYLLLKP